MPTDTLDQSAVPTGKKSDLAAITLSLVCIVHCLALPIFAASLPFIAVLAEAEWVHVTFAVLAVLVSGSVVLMDKGARVPIFLAPAMIGIFLLVIGLFAESLGMDETVATVIGGVFLAAAHFGRMLRGR
ncbi:MAG: MerC domain-containing protein [Pseudomonadota bacterium]